MVEVEDRLFPQRMKIKQEKDTLDDHITNTIDHHQLKHLLIVPDRNGGFSGTIDLAAKDEGPKELERVYIKQYDEQKHAVQNDGGQVVEAIASKEYMLFVPNQHQQGEADAKSKKAPHRGKKLFEGLRHFQRDDQQGDSKGENGVAKGFDALDLLAAEVECVTGGRVFPKDVLS